MESIELLLVGSIFCLTGIALFFLTKRLRTSGTRTIAKIIGHKTVRDHEDSTVNEQFEFTDKNGKVLQATSLFGTSFGFYSKGKKIEIVYDEKDPKKALPNKLILLNAYLFPIILGLLLIIIHFAIK